MSGKIPCSVCILTHNSATTLPRALESVRDFAEVIVCDGGSADATIDIARQFGARIMQQDSKFLDMNGGIIDFAGVRNQTLTAATEEWFFYLDSDEVLSRETVSSIRDAVAGAPAVYWVPRKYEFEGKVIVRSIGYPNRQKRLFSRSLVHAFVKQVHERPDHRSDVHVGILSGYILVPVDTSGSLDDKMLSYLEIELQRHGVITFPKLARMWRSSTSTLLLYVYRFFRTVLFRQGERMTWAYEFRPFRYHIQLLQRATSKFLFSV